MQFSTALPRGKYNNIFLSDHHLFFPEQIEGGRQRLFQYWTICYRPQCYWSQSEPDGDWINQFTTYYISLKLYYLLLPPFYFLLSRMNKLLTCNWIFLVIISIFTHKGQSLCKLFYQNLLELRLIFQWTPIGFCIPGYTSHLSFQQSVKHQEKPIMHTKADVIRDHRLIEEEASHK